MHDYIVDRLDLQRFADGGDAGGADTGAQTTGEKTAAAAPKATKAGKANPLANVVYGKQETGNAGKAEEVAPPQETTKTTDGAGKPEVSAEDRQAEFDRMRTGDLKDLFDAWAQSTVKERLKATKETVDRYNSLTPVLNALGRKYGIDAKDVTALTKAVEADDSYWQSMSERTGMTVEQCRRYDKMERQNEQLIAESRDRDAHDHAAKQYAAWCQQAEKAKVTYPDLDLEAEIRNPDFARMLRAGVDVGSAYLVLHKDEIIPAAMQRTAQNVEQKISQSIQAGAKRPAENGSANQSPVVVKNDVSKFTNADLDEIARRVLRGERIVL